MRLDSLQTGIGATWVVNPAMAPDAFITRRNNIGGSFDNRQIVWEQHGGTATSVLGPVPGTQEAVLALNNLYLGTDNIFNNTGNSSGNNATIERVDVLYTTAIVATASRGVLVMERGATNAHDAFRIAAVLSVDGSGNPLSYGTLSAISNWGATSLGQINTTVLRTDDMSSPYAQSANVVGQHLGGVLIPLTDLVSAGVPIYGYSLFANDVTGTGGQNLVDWTTFPTATAETNGGMDMVAANVGILSVSEVPEPNAGYTVFCGAAAILAAAFRRRRTA
jgi:hypothetical protein